MRFSVFSDVCNRSLCVIPVKTEMAKNQEHPLKLLTLIDTVL